MPEKQDTEAEPGGGPKPTITVRGRDKGAAGEVEFPNGLVISYDIPKGVYRLNTPDGPLMELQYNGKEFVYKLFSNEETPPAEGRPEKAAPSPPPRPSPTPRPPRAANDLDKLRQYLAGGERRISEIRQHMNYLETDDVRKLLEKLRDKGEAVMNGTRKGARYTLKK